MQFVLKPLKNIDFRQEEKYLETKYQQGLTLKKAGTFFYIFEKNQEQTVNCQILLVEKNSEHPNSNTFVKKNLLYRKFDKVYQITEQTEIKPQEDRKARFKFYKLYMDLYGMIGVATCLSMILWQGIYLSAGTIGFEIPRFVGQIFLYTLLSSVIWLILSTKYDRLAREYAEKEEDYWDTRIEYNIFLDKIADLEQRKQVEQSLKKFGGIYKVNDTFLKMRSSAAKADIIETVTTETGITTNDFGIMSAFDLYVPKV